MLNSHIDSTAVTAGTARHSITVEHSARRARTLLNAMQCRERYLIIRIHLSFNYICLTFIQCFVERVSQKKLLSSKLQYSPTISINHVSTEPLFHSRLMRFFASLICRICDQFCSQMKDRWKPSLRGDRRCNTCERCDKLRERHERTPCYHCRLMSLSDEHRAYEAQEMERAMAQSICTATAHDNGDNGTE